MKLQNILENDVTTASFKIIVETIEHQNNVAIMRWRYQYLW